MPKPRLVGLLAAAVVGMAAPAPARAHASEIEIGDVALFFTVYDAAGGQPTAEQLQKKIEAAFVGDEDKRDLSSCLYNGTQEKPGDRGYWVGYRIVEAYYLRAADRRAAVREILEMKDPKAFLAKSGWSPGIALP